ncbi:hypothetical protein N658DRAFT_464217 [Parathielavia hyrcaniae]|uniref:Uncharacterized protein n=1 Tax=Parathielavia hyrcaniae TaxID=113614 RepID=A0AAN6T538_9PEZI|nr:hypothetical protein N658DRAFT_464217 [Parathielavia hyrcaniae]
MPHTPPTFSFGRAGPRQHNHRPTFSSPLSSSPIRASGLLSPPATSHQQQQNYQTTSQPLSPCDPNHLNTLPRETQSSPILGKSVFGSNTPNITNNGSNSINSSKFRFASRPARPNPLLKRREDAQDGRRRLFFQNVRQRQEDRRWEMRGGEDEVRLPSCSLLKLEWWRHNRERLQAKEAELAEYLGPMMDADVFVREEEEFQRAAAQEEDGDAMMADFIAQQEEAEVEALLAALEYREGDGSSSPLHFSDDEDYDGLFMDLIQSQQGAQGAQGLAHSQDVEMS